MRVCEIVFRYPVSPDIIIIIIPRTVIRCVCVCVYGCLFLISCLFLLFLLILEFIYFLLINVIQVLHWGLKRQIANGSSALCFWSRIKQKLEHCMKVIYIKIFFETHSRAYTKYNVMIRIEASAFNDVFEKCQCGFGAVLCPSLMTCCCLLHFNSFTSHSTFSLCWPAVWL